MLEKMLKTAVVVCLIIAAAAVSTYGRAKLIGNEKELNQNLASAIIPYHCIAAHRVGKIVLAVNNNGTFGTGFAVSTADCFTGETVRSCEYPKRSNTSYLFAGAFWIGAVVGRDTLVTVGADGWQYIREMFPDDKYTAVFKKRSIIDPSKPEYEDAISEEDYIFTYTDTFPELVASNLYNPVHIPLYIGVTQSSFSWSYEYAEDFVLFDYKIKNIGTRTLDSVYMGLYVDADVCFGPIPCAGGFDDDICGFLEKRPFTYKGYTFDITTNIAWIADNDGDLDKVNDPQSGPVPHVTGMRIVRTPATRLDVSFNWWVSNGDPSLDFGPREKPYRGRWKEPYRDFGTGGLGTPEGDANKYYVLRNKEFDYDQVFTSSIPDDPASDWLYPAVGGLTEARIDSITRGYDTRYLLSFGPFTIDPGQTLPVSFAYVAGENFHTDENNLNNLPHHPEIFYSNLNFEDLTKNAVWASWIYDNPGVDTDEDGFAGKNHIFIRDSTMEMVIDSFFDTVWINDTLIDHIDTTIDTSYNVDTLLADTIWYEGDGVPDFRGASPPPAPTFWITPTVGALHVRFNGQRSETTRDVFSGDIDFEGYRIYLARDERATSYSVVASYDLEDYNKYVYDTTRNEWVLNDNPFSLEQLRCLYGDSCKDPFFDPLVYTISSPYVHSGPWGDSLFYFTMQDYNQSELGLPHGIRKRFPDQPFPSTLNPDSARPEELTEDGYLKYFEYEFVIEDLLPTVPYWVNVTAFDFGSPSSGLPSLESSVTVGAKSAYPLSSADEVAQKDLKVIVYPNPYRIDAGYRSLGYEGRTELDRPDDRVRAIHFANLPPKCTIRIFTLDGDLVREIEHNYAPSDPNASHETWNLITRNTQLVVSGLYYWTVESEDGETQIGKLVIIM